MQVFHLQNTLKSKFISLLFIHTELFPNGYSAFKNITPNTDEEGAMNRGCWNVGCPLQ